MEIWCEENQIDLKFIQKGKPSQNGYIEKFNRTYRDEILDQYLFETLSQVRDATSQFMWEYNNERPHKSLGRVTPRDFLLKYGKVSDFPTFQHDIYNRRFDEEFILSSVAG